jgi:outer membrane protein assembly factor BamE (lipoprotein component of BamABCDE complex)
MIRKLLSTAIVAAFIGTAGCSPVGIDNPDARLANLRDGKTTIDQVTQEFGTPKTDKSAPDGTRTVTYALMQQQSSSDAHTPFLGPWSGKITTVENDLTMTFDKGGVLQSHSSAIKPIPDASSQ